MKLNNIIYKSLITILIAGQLAFCLNFVMAPKPAQAFLGIGDFTFNTEIANVYDILKDVGIGAAQRIAIQYANKYIQQFVDKLIDKYRIKDYLAYDKVLSGYYLNQYIYKNVADPDLRAIYGILATDVNSRAVVGPPGVDCSKVPASCQPVLAALKQKLDSYYYKRGGINPSKIYYPDASMTDEDYFQMARAYFSNPQSFSDQELYGQYGEMLAASQKAASQELTASPGLKSDRSTPTNVVPHICDGYDANIEPTSMISKFLSATGIVHMASAAVFDSQADCEAQGGTWKIDGSGLAQSAIQNPSAFIHDFATSAINSIFTNNFGVRDNIYTTIGSLLGNFIFLKLTLNKKGGTLNEDGSIYDPTLTNVGEIKQLDLDGDGIPDAQDIDGDGQPDNCIYGGIPTQDGNGNFISNPGPPCLGSVEALTSHPVEPNPPAPSPSPSPNPNPDCPSQDEVNQWLANNPGDEARLPQVFPGCGF